MQNIREKKETALQKNSDLLLRHKQRLSGFDINNSITKGENYKFTIEAAGLSLDYSKNIIDQELIDTLLNIAKQSGTQQAIQALYNGETVNNTENTPALHTLLRASDNEISEKNQHYFNEIASVRSRFSDFVNSIQTSARKGVTNKAFSSVVNIGIGGSDLGPAMAYQALENYKDSHIDCYFVSNVDPEQIDGILRTLNPETTLFIVSSKSFTTQESLINAQKAKSWLLENIKKNDQDIIAKHFVAVTAKQSRAIAFGINKDNIFPIWDWVGGRYSMWSSISLSLAISIGMDNFNQLLAGSRSMDQHFITTPHANNMPVILALLSVWYTGFMQCKSHAIIPYSQALSRLPAYLQQLVMESNGKSVRKGGASVDYATCPILWGEAGTNSQHSFFQLLHQGPTIVPVDFILPLTTHSDPEQHKLLIANCLAQSRALMLGKSSEHIFKELNKSNTSYENIDILAKHKSMPGNRPSNIISMKSLNPYTLGSLVALYEHKTYVESILWDINAFDQWGVELGKEMCQSVLDAMEHKTDLDIPMDPSTNRAIEAYQLANIAH